MRAIDQAVWADVDVDVEGPEHTPTVHENSSRQYMSRTDHAMPIQLPCDWTAVGHPPTHLTCLKPPPVPCNRRPLSPNPVNFLILSNNRETPAAASISPGPNSKRCGVTAPNTPGGTGLRCAHSADPFGQLNSFHPPNGPSQKAPQLVSWAPKKEPNGHLISFSQSELTFRSQSLTEHEKRQRIWSIESTIGAVEACCPSGFGWGDGDQPSTEACCSSASSVEEVDLDKKQAQCEHGACRRPHGRWLNPEIRHRWLATCRAVCQHRSQSCCSMEFRVM